MEEMKKTLVKMLMVFGVIGFMMACQTQETNTAKDEKAKDSTAVSVDTLEVTIDSVVAKRMLTEPDYDTTQWADIALLDTSIIIDMKYATIENFVGEKMYDCGRCFLRPEVAQSVLEIQRILREKGLGLKMYDCYRPRPIQYALWKKYLTLAMFPIPRKVLCIIGVRQWTLPWSPWMGRSWKWEPLLIILERKPTIAIRNYLKRY